MFKKIALALAMLIAPAFAMALCNPFVPNTVLTASALNTAISAPCITSGTITGSVISGVSLDGSAIGSITPSSSAFTYLTANSLDANGYSAEFSLYGNTTNPGIAFKDGRGTAAIPVASLSGDTLGNIDAFGYSGTVFGYGASIHFVAAGNFSGTSYPTKLNFNTTATGSTTPVNVGSLDNTGLSLPTAGIMAAGAFSDAYTDGVVADYATGNGRISVGAADTVTIYTGGIATTQMEQISSTGNTVLGIRYGTAGSGKLASSVTAPTIASGFGTSPAVTQNNGTATFLINVGTGGTASSGVVTMPAATTGWSCDVSPTAAPQAAAVMYSAPTSATSITITNYTQSTGAALAWVASTVIAVNCIGY